MINFTALIPSYSNIYKRDSIHHVIINYQSCLWANNLLSAYFKHSFQTILAVIYCLAFLNFQLNIQLSVFLKSGWLALQISVLIDQIHCIHFLPDLQRWKLTIFKQIAERTYFFLYLKKGGKQLVLSKIEKGKKKKKKNKIISTCV